MQSCSTSTCNSGGAQLCDDTTGEPVGACVANSSCLCAAGACASCRLAHRKTADVARQAPCAPGVGKMNFPQCTQDGAPCTIEVLAPTSGDWYGYIAATPTSGWATKITGVTNGEAYLEAKLAAGDVVGQGGSSVGTLNLMITQNNQSQLLPVDLQLREDPAVATCQPITGTNTYAMSCVP